MKLTRLDVPKFLTLSLFSTSLIVALPGTSQHCTLSSSPYPLLLAHGEHSADIQERGGDDADVRMSWKRVKAVEM